MHVETLARQGKKQIVPEGLYDALIAVVDLLQKMVRKIIPVRAQHRYSSTVAVTPRCGTKPKLPSKVRNILSTLHCGSISTAHNGDSHLLLLRTVIDVL